MQTCRRCIYDESLPSISFDDQGICNYCRTHDALDRQHPTGAEGERRLLALADEIKAAGKGKPYDCIMGVSGGCDSSFLLYKLKELGLRPLAAHFDNTWNSAIATTNIRRMTEALDIDLFTYVVNNREYDDIYRAFMTAGVPDIEAPTDIGLATTQYLAAQKYGIKYIIEGHSFRTEGISPLGWSYMDGRYVKSVHQQYGTRPMETFPNLTLARQLKWMMVNRLKRVRPLYHLDYKKDHAMRLLKEKFGWQWYGGHHLENRFTAFYHRYFMPMRFGIDTRLLGYAALVRSGQMERAEALALMQTSPFDNQDVRDLVALVQKRLGYRDNEFLALMNAPKRTYREFPNYKRTFERLRPFFWAMYKLDLVPQSFYMKYTRPDPTTTARPALNGPA